MPSQIDRVGCFRGHIAESGVGATKSGYPQFVGRFVASKMYVEDKDRFEAFGLTEAGWVDWSSYEQEMTGYLVLLTEKDGEPKEIFHMDALRKALGWDGGSFNTLGTTDWSQKEITFWVEENEYNGVTRLQVVAIDDSAASPSRSLRALDASGLKNLDQKYAGMLKKTPVVAAKPATAPAKAPASPPKAAPGKAAPSAVKATPPTTAPGAAGAAAKAPPKTSPPKVAAKPAPSAPAATEEAAWTQTEAWDHVLANKGAATDDAMAEKWIDASTAVAPGKDETNMTSEEWHAIAAKTLEMLAA